MEDNLVLCQMQELDKHNDPLMMLVDAAVEEDFPTLFNRDMDAQTLKAYMLESQLEVRNIVSCHQETGECHSLK